MKKFFVFAALLALGFGAAAADKVAGDAIVAQAREMNRARLAHRLQPVTREQFGLPPVPAKKEGK